MLFFNISGDDFRVRSKTVKTVLFRIKFMRCAEGKNTVKLKYNFILCFFFRLTLKYWKSDSRKINYNFFKMPHRRRPSQNFSGHAARWRSVSQKYNVIWSPDHYPCLVLGLVYREQEKQLWALTFSNYRSTINIANIETRKLAWHSFAPIVPKFPHKF